MSIPERPTPLAVFARAPEPGQTKTRLADAVGPERAAELHRAFIDDTLRTAVYAGFEVTLWCAGDTVALRELAAGHGVSRVAQPAGDLGARMTAALESGLAEAGRALVIGTDAPTLPARLLRAADAALAGEGEGGPDLVLGPSADGGYYTIGAAGRVPPVFDGVAWSTARVLEQTVARARRDGLRWMRLPPWYDVDTPADLRLLRLHLTLAPELAPTTAAFLFPRAD